MNLQPIGTIRTGRQSVDDTPVQTALNVDEPGRIEFDEVYAPALSGLDEFSHLWIVTWLGTAGQPVGADIEMEMVPFLLRPAGETKGALATRTPFRPNPVGLHLVRIERVSFDPPVIEFRGVDMVDGTPVLDVKPWVSHFDTPGAGTGSGWYERLEVERVTPAEMDRRRAAESDQTP